MKSFFCFVKRDKQEKRKEPKRNIVRWKTQERGINQRRKLKKKLNLTILFLDIHNTFHQKNSTVLQCESNLANLVYKRGRGKKKITFSSYLLLAFRIVVCFFFAFFQELSFFFCWLFSCFFTFF